MTERKIISLHHGNVECAEGNIKLVNELVDIFRLNTCRIIQAQVNDLLAQMVPSLRDYVNLPRFQWQPYVTREVFMHQDPDLVKDVQMLTQDIQSCRIRLEQFCQQMDPAYQPEHIRMLSR